MTHTLHLTITTLYFTETLYHNHKTRLQITIYYLSNRIFKLFKTVSSSSLLTLFK